MGSLSTAFALEKGLLPKNPLDALIGLGCADSITVCFSVSMRDALSLAYRPQSTKTMD